MLAGCLARFMRLPAWEMRRAPTSSPTRMVRLGAMAIMRFLRYSYNFEYRAKLGTYLLIDSEEAQQEGIAKSRRILEQLLT